MLEQNLNGQTLDIVTENVQKLKALFPEIVSEDKIDFEKLQMVLGKYIEKDNERYNFTWNGKGKALRLAQTPSTGTLRPCREESKDWDKTQNLYIEGDNLEVLKLLQKTYHNKIKMIYIDPPYNTGKDFVYPDDFKDSLENYLRITAQKNEDGSRLSTNSESNGRYHTNWLNMMYPRLRLARNLLRDDGVLFISIDDKELENLKKISNEVFGEENFVANIVWQKKYAVSNDDPGIAPMHDHILVYQKSSSFQRLLLPRTEKQLKRYQNIDNDSRGEWTSGEYVSSKSRWERPTLWYPIKHPKTGKDVWPDENAVWRYSKEKHQQIVLEDRLYWGTDMSYEKPRLKRFLSEIQDGVVPSTWWPFSDVGHNDEAQKETGELLGKKVFSTPKPVRLIHRMLSITTSSNDIVLDFFSGSAASAHAVMQINAEDGDNRKFIMVQLPEICDENSEAFKAGYQNICEIGKERIRRAGEKIINSEELRVKSEQGDHGDQATLNFALSTVNSNERSSLDIGFKVFKLDSSNLKKWNPDYDNLEASLEGMVSNYVDGRTELDVVYEIMLKYGIDLTLPVEEYDFSGKKVHSIGFGALVICLDNDITTSLAQDIVKLKKELSPETMRVVFKDNGFANDAAKTNVKENLRQAGIDEFVTV